MNRLSKTIFAVGLVGISALALSGPAQAAETNTFPYNCTGQSGLILDSYAAQNVGHYHNGSLVASWYNAGGLDRRTYHPPTSATASVYSSYNIWSSSAGCYINA